MLIGQITDTHIKRAGELIYGKFDTAAYLQRAISHINSLQQRPDIVLATGDLVDAGAPEEYQRLRHLLAPLAMPVYLIPGNHDARAPLRAAFPEHLYFQSGEFLHYVIEGLPLRLVALDTLVPGAPHGELCDARLSWLADRLAEQRRPTIVFMHHPPFESGVAWIDAMRLTKGAERLAEIVRSHRHVEHVLCGHVHRAVQVRWAGTSASIAPSTAHQLLLSLGPDGARGLAADPPAVALHYWRPETGLVSHLSFVPTPPREDRELPFQRA